MNADDTVAALAMLATLAPLPPDGRARVLARMVDIIHNGWSCPDCDWPNERVATLCMGCGRVNGHDQ